MNTYRTLHAREAFVALLIAAFLPLCPTTGVALEFASPVSYPVGTSPAAVVIADFNGDGKPDLAVANSGSGNVSILLGNGDGTYKPAANFDAGMASPTSIEVADFNNDGIQDLAVWTLSGPVGSTLSVLLGNGDGTFQAPHSTPLPAAVDLATLDLAVADFNLDHNPDLAVLVHDANGGTSRIIVLLGKGDGTFQSPQQSSIALNTVVGSNNKYLVSADLNNDTKPDLAVQVSGGIQILLGQGDGTFSGGVTVLVAGGLVVSDLTVADFNGDGKLDLLTKADAPNTSCSSPFKKPGTVSKIDVFLGNGDGSFQAEQVLDNAATCKVFTGEGFGLQGSVIGAPSAGDFNGDGRLDLEYQISNFSRGMPDDSFGAIRLGRTDKTLSLPVPLGSLVASGVTVVAKDLNGDKLSDLIYLDSANSAALVVLNTSPTSGADLAILASDAHASVYSAVMMNEGPDAATGVTFKDTLPNTVNLVSATATQGNCTHANGVVTCAIGSLAPGFDVTVNMPVTMGPNAADGTVTNNMNVTATEPDLAPANNMAVQNTGVFSVTVQTAGSGRGTVTSSPSGINCGTVCSQHYLSGSYFALIPTASSGAQFSGWSGDCGGTDPNGCASNISSDVSVTAKFDMTPAPPPASGGGGAFAWWDLCAMLLLVLWRRAPGGTTLHSASLEHNATRGRPMKPIARRSRLNTVCLSLIVLMSANAVSAATLSVNCGAKEGLHSIGAALRYLQNAEGHSPTTINVSGACHENIVVQSLDRLTLNAVNNASVSDASGGTLDVISIQDSRDVAINGFTINAGAGASSNGINCGDFSICRLSHNLLQGASSGAGLAIYTQAQATLDGDILQNNGIGLFMRSGTKVRGGPFTSQNNGQGINIGRQAFAFIIATVQNNSDAGIIVQWQSTLELTSGSITGNGSAGAAIRESSFARFSGSTVSGNAAGGVVISDLSMGDFAGSTVTGNGGGTDIACSPQFAATRGAVTTGGTTNCVEP